MKRTMILGTILGVAAVNAGAQDIDRLAAEARAQSVRLIQELGGRLRQEMASGGPETAIGVCKDAAPEIASRLSRESGSRIARVSLKTRNPLLGTPDAWEQGVLEEFDRRVAAGARPDILETAEIVAEPKGRYFRYMKAIPVQTQCIACHGTDEAIGQSVRERLHEDYPHDRATGYAPGQVRGAVTVKTFLGN
ncbi:MAG: DUF3365 domain-containing protein [Burkholderiales bacterium]|nr:DUF3365 domain-containing protein [Burkholderiales bacterium]